jgi:hypothetical protein
MLSRVWASLFLWNIASLEKENVPSMVDANVGICFPNRRDRERESTGANGQAPLLSKPLSSIYSGGGEIHFCVIPLVGWEIRSES